MRHDRFLRSSLFAQVPEVGHDPCCRKPKPSIIPKVIRARVPVTNRLAVGVMPASGSNPSKFMKAMKKNRYMKYGANFLPSSGPMTL